MEQGKLCRDEIGGFSLQPSSSVPCRQRRDCGDPLDCEARPVDAGGPVRVPAEDGLVGRDDQVDADVVLGGGDRGVGHLEGVDGCDDDSLRAHQAGLGEEGELDVALADAGAVAVDGDAAEDDQVQRSEGLDLDRRGDRSTAARLAAASAGGMVRLAGSRR